jgi:hypothetical protein
LPKEIEMKKFILVASVLVLTTSFASAQEMRLRHDADDMSRGAVKMRPDAETRRAMDSNKMNNTHKTTTPDMKKPRTRHDVK